MCTTSLSTSLAGTCAAVKKAGGVNKKIYAFSVKDITAVTFEADGTPSALTFTTGKQLVSFTGKSLKNTASEPITAEGEGNVNIFVQTVQPVLFHSTQADRVAIEQLFALDQVVFLVPMPSGQILAYGLSNDTETLQNYGLKLTEGDDAVGLILNDMNAQTCTFAGDMLHKAIIWNEAQTYAQNITDIEAYLTPAA
jgi:hypothetical protein